MKKKINIQFLIITLLAILTTVSLSIFVFYELFKQEVMADLKTNTQLLVETDAWEQIVEKKDAGALDDGVKQLRLTLVDGTGEVIWIPMQKSAVWTITVQDRRFHRHCRPEKGRQSASPAQSVKMRFIMPYGWRTEVSCARQRKQAVSQVFSRAFCR